MSSQNVVAALLEEYSKTTSAKLKLIDAFLLCIMLTGAVQFVYCLRVGTFPFNSFLSGFISAIGTFVLTVSLRMQSTPDSKIVPERAFADWLFANIVFHVAIVGFLG